MMPQTEQNAAITIGARVGNYHVVRMIGRGGMATVYEVVHDRLGGKAAIKVLHPELSQRPEIVARFLNEGRAVNHVQHPGLVRIFEYGQLPDRSAYIIMEYLGGESLSARLTNAGGRLDCVEVMRIGRQIASALAATHEKGIIHRDLKPDNVMMVSDAEAAGGERARVLDFGIAKLTEPPLAALSAEEPAAVTMAGTLLGTPLYMAPEQCRGDEGINGKADVYSLGVMLYQMLAGERPLEAPTPMGVLAKQLFEVPRPLRERRLDVPAPLAELVERMLAKDREQRPSMAQVVEHLEHIGAPRGQHSRWASEALVGSGAELRALTPVGGAQRTATFAERARRRSVWIPSALLLFLLAAGAWWIARRPEPRRPASAAEPVPQQAEAPQPISTPQREVTAQPTIAAPLPVIEGRPAVAAPPRRSQRIASERERSVIRKPRLNPESPSSTETVAVPPAPTPPPPPPPEQAPSKKARNEKIPIMD